jgi:hypothetical protein
MTKYLLKSSPKNEQKQDSDLSSNEIAFQNLIHEINDDLVVHKKVFRMTQLLEKYKAYHKLLSEQNRHNSTREPVYHHFDSMRTPSTCSHAHRMQFYVL